MQMCIKTHKNRSCIHSACRPPVILQTLSITELTHSLVQQWFCGSIKRPESQSFSFGQYLHTNKEFLPGSLCNLRTNPPRKVSLLYKIYKNIQTINAKRSFWGLVILILVIFVFSKMVLLSFANRKYFNFFEKTIENPLLCWKNAVGKI